jgi:hypothetical protein
MVFSGYDQTVGRQASINNKQFNKHQFDNGPQKCITMASRQKANHFKQALSGGFHGGNASFMAQTFFKEKGKSHK